MAPGDKGVPGGRSDTPPAPLPMAASALMGLPPALAGTCTGRGVPSASAAGVVCMLGCWARKAAKAASLHSCVVQGWLSGMPTAMPWGIGLQWLPPDPRFPLPSNVHVAHSPPAFCIHEPPGRPVVCADESLEEHIKAAVELWTGREPSPGCRHAPTDPSSCCLRDCLAVASRVPCQQKPWRCFLPRSMVGCLPGYSGSVVPCCCCVRQRSQASSPRQQPSPLPLPPPAAAG
jgi:hypothetical protein